MTINCCHFSGNLTRNAEVKTLPSGQSVSEFTVAVNNRQKNVQTGEWENVPAYIDCSLWGERATLLEPKMGKGARCVVMGRMKQESWTDRATGQNRKRLKMLVDEIEVMEAVAKRESASVYSDDDIPF